MSPDEGTPRLYHAGAPWTAGDAALVFALAIATFLLVPAFAGAELLGIVVAEILGLALVPVLVVRMRGLPLATLGLRLPPWRGLVGGVLIGASIWYVAAWLTAPWAELLGDRGEAVEPLKQMVERTPMASLLALSLVPAVCEEIATRGLLTLGLARRLGAVAAVAISAAAFAALHVSLVRAVPTALLGVVFAVVTLRTASLVPAMIAHALNNLIALTVSTDRAPPIARLITDHPDACMLAAAVIAATGIGIAWPKRN
jgi:membrane protease YdiL (CAAX protease family)